MNHASRKRVCVVGAGASGIACLHEFSRHKDGDFEIVCFESRAQAGGAWLYDEPGECRVTYDSAGRVTASSPYEVDDGYHPTPMYNGLRTNLPADLMAFRRAPFPEGTPMFPDQCTVLAYLQARARQVEHLIRYSTMVTRIRKPPHARHWQVEHRTIGSAERPQSASFDYVVIANGHYAQPYIPPLKGLKEFPGEVLHSRWYRTPETFAGKTVLVVGASASGSDIARELAKTHQEGSKGRVYLSVRGEIRNGIDPRSHGAPSWARYITVVPGLSKLEGEIVVCGDITLQSIDVIIFATGYLFHYPFCHISDEPFATHLLTRPPPAPSSDGSLAVNGHSGGDVQPSLTLGGLRVHNLDVATSILYEPDPTLALPCLAYRIVPFPFAEAQARFLAKLWSGGTIEVDITKPPEPPFQAVAASIDEGDETKAAHEYGAPHEFDYADRILRLVGEGQGAEVLPDGGLGAVSKTRRNLRNQVGKLRMQMLGI